MSSTASYRGQGTVFSVSPLSPEGGLIFTHVKYGDVDASYCRLDKTFSVDSKGNVGDAASGEASHFALEGSVVWGYPEGSLMVYPLLASRSLSDNTRTDSYNPTVGFESANMDEDGRRKLTKALEMLSDKYMAIVENTSNHQISPTWQLFFDDECVYKEDWRSEENKEQRTEWREKAELEEWRETLAAAKALFESAKPNTDVKAIDDSKM